LEKNSILTLKAISIAKNQKNLKKFLFASTSEIYSKSIEILKTRIPTPENTSVVLSNPSNKRSTYFLTKIFGESLVHHSKLPFIIFRPHNIYGPRMGMSHVIPEIVFKLKKAKKNISAYSASHTRSFCYIDDAVNQLVFMLSKSYVVKKTFNLGNQLEEISIKNLIKKIQTKMKKGHIEIQFKTDNHGSQSRRCPDMSKLKSLYNFKTTSIDSGLNKTIKWYLKNK
jgi:nucleoside-diphosphate-sugar epimerase